jgi:hypothetical protein
MNAALESAIRDWLLADPDLADLTILTGQSPEIIPGDQPVVFVSCENTDTLALRHYKVRAQLIVSTPAVIEDSLAAHQGISGAVKASLLSIAGLVAYLPSGLILAGADLNSFGDSIGSERWTTTADLSLAVIEI